GSRRIGRQTLPVTRSADISPERQLIDYVISREGKDFFHRNKLSNDVRGDIEAPRLSPWAPFTSLVAGRLFTAFRGILALRRLGGQSTDGIVGFINRPAYLSPQADEAMQTAVLLSRHRA